MLTDKTKIAALEEEVKSLEKQMKFVIEMIGAPDAKTFEKNVKRDLKKQDEEMTAHYKKLGWPIAL